MFVSMYDPLKKIHKSLKLQFQQKNFLFLKLCSFIEELFSPNACSSLAQRGGEAAGTRLIPKDRQTPIGGMRNTRGGGVAGCESAVVSAAPRPAPSPSSSTAGMHPAREAFAPTKRPDPACQPKICVAADAAAAPDLVRALSGLEHPLAAASKTVC